MKKLRQPTAIDRWAGEEIRAIRKKAGLSLMSVAEGTSVTNQQLSKYETAINRMSVGHFVQICNKLDRNPANVLRKILTGGAT